MEEAEAVSLVLEYLELVHTYGEAIWNRIDLWVGVSFGMILLGYFAPERLQTGITGLILSLYALFSITLFSNVTGDTEKADAALFDAFAIAESHGLDLRILAAYTDPRGDEFYTSVLFLIGLFVGTIWFLIATCVKNVRDRSSSAESNT
jgi:hypothetical protein